MKVLVLDNYDSFTYNLVHMLHSMDVVCEVCRNDEIDSDEAQAFDVIILSPGPGIPSEAGHMSKIIESCAGNKPILGICLGHQAIAEYLGATLRNMPKVYHGIKDSIFINSNDQIFHGVPKKIQVGRYHSWEVSRQDLPADISVLAEDKFGTIMALSDPIKKLYGIQFHPESVMTEYGELILKNFIKISETSHQSDPKMTSEF